jgi:hypothetical protein
VRDTFCCWSSPKPLPAPLPSLSALARQANWTDYRRFPPLNRADIGGALHLSGAPTATNSDTGT